MTNPSADPLGEHFATVVLELAPDGIAVTDEHGRILHANGRFEDLFGYAREQLIGHTVEMLLPERLQAAHRAHRHDYEQAPAIRPMGRGVDLRARHADGTELLVEVALSPVTTGAGVRTIMAVRQVDDRSVHDLAVGDRAVAADETRIAAALNDRVVRPVFSSSLTLHGLMTSLDERQAQQVTEVLAELDAAIWAVREIVYDLGADPRPDGLPADIEAIGGGSIPGRLGATPELVIEYTIDAADRLHTANAGWAAFARSNDAPELVRPDHPPTLWAAMTDDDVRGIWQLIVRRVRAERVEIRLPFRCDAPHARRWFEMTVSPGPEETVRFRSVLVAEEPRPPIALLHRATSRDPDAPAVPVCSWCGRVHDGDDWADIEDAVRARRLLDDAPSPPIAHGICPTCAREMAAEAARGAGHPIRP